jgi:hypothetical protein
MALISVGPQNGRSLMFYAHRVDGIGQFIKG